MMTDWPRVLRGRDGLFFAAAIDRMGKGWDAGMELLAKLPAELQHILSTTPHSAKSTAPDSKNKQGRHGLGTLLSALL